MTTVSAGPETAVAELNLRFLLDYPAEAAHRLEVMPPDEVAELLAAQPIHAVVPVWQYLAVDVEQAVIGSLPEPAVLRFLGEIEPARAAALLLRVDPDRRDHYLALLDAPVARELRAMMDYPQDSAGQLMDPRVVVLRGDNSVSEALARLRLQRRRGLRQLFLADVDGRLEGRVDVHDVAVSDPEQTLEGLRRKITVAVGETANREDVVEVLAQNPVTDLPVVDHAGRLVGVIQPAAMVSAVQAETSLDIQTMVGASKEERALSLAGFAVKKRLPWLQINLLTAFLAAAVVGVFEGTIARFTALAVLLPVVAGQSGNSGAQALAITMRGLVLREISVRHWPQMLLKEFRVGFINGLAVAATTAVGVYVWSGSQGLVIVISTAMVISMVVAGMSGALVPITLRRFGQDPAQSSSIILTTITDVVGFFSFLGIATLLSSLL
jgi:magnesium transporter